MEVGEEEREGNEVFLEISVRKVRKIWMAAFSDIEDKPMRGQVASYMISQAGVKHQDKL